MLLYVPFGVESRFDLTLLLLLLKLCERRPVVIGCVVLWVGVKLLSGLPDSRFDNIVFFLSRPLFVHVILCISFLLISTQLV